MAYINGNAVFYGVHNVSGDILDKTVTSIDDGSITTIGDYALYKCENLVSVNCPNVTSLGGSAFRNCTALKNVKTGNLKTIGSSAFYGCKTLEGVYLFPEETEAIGGSAFQGCDKLLAFIVEGTPTLGGGQTFPPQATIFVKRENKGYFQNATNWATLFNDGRIKPIDGGDW